MTPPQLTVGLSGRISVIFRPDTEKEGREIIRAVETAPELLEALKDMYLGRGHPGDRIDRALAALAKATEVTA